jgi:NAD(P)-dependent dehydrogenase (short-subunit alcohol dehydrogenase family)
MPSAFITGANRGLGFEFARQYLTDGWQVYAACRDPASELHRLADASGDKLQIVALDVTHPASIKSAAAELDGGAIDLLLNNAGVGGARGQTIGNIDYKAWAKVLEVNTMGPIRVSEAFVEHVARSERKLIVTLTSGMGSIADNASGGAFAYRKGRGEHGHAQFGNRSGSPRYYLRGRQSRLGADRHGWSTRDLDPSRERIKVEAVDRQPKASAVRHVFQSRRSRIRLVGAPHMSASTLALPQATR